MSKSLCQTCEKLELSYDGKPFAPASYPGRSIGPNNYICGCGQKWWRYNSYFQLWSRVDDEATWRNTLAGCPEPVAIGNPSRNLH